ncbi:MAG TPA: formimidoylglutamate deiminase [Vicinamibacteria bacterium]|nr:formimidoylglutamate deiminase [Vicinamibacteria bacterium]
MSRIVEPDLVWLPGGFQSGHQVEILDDGTFGRIGESFAETAERLSGEALLPGMVNAHSHAFQRGLRGKSETFPRESGSFWSWREQMYRLAERMDSREFHRQSLLAFREMVRGGITSVGEFHYLHHPPAGDEYELDRVVLDAAREAGIRIVLLDVCYLSGDVGEPLRGAQTRFGSASAETFVASVERLFAGLDSRSQSLGIAAHSIRAVPIEAIVALHLWALEKGLVFHMHVEEQQREIEASVARYGKRPLALLLDRLELGPESSAVHCTHSQIEELTRLFASGANVVICPLTEANLADGIPPDSMTRAGAHLALGTDSNSRIDFTEEMRLLEYAQRLRSGRRGAFVGSDGRVAERLFQIATEGGARSLGLRAGRIESGYAADFFTVAVDEEIPVAERLTELVFSRDRSAVKQVAVGGRYV